MLKFIKYPLLVVISVLIFNCSSDNDNCPDIIEINLDDPESIKRAEECGLAPAEPLGTIWVSENYRLKHNL